MPEEPRFQTPGTDADRLARLDRPGLGALGGVGLCPDGDPSAVAADSELAAAVYKWGVESDV